MSKLAIYFQGGKFHHIDEISVDENPPNISEMVYEIIDKPELFDFFGAEKYRVESVDGKLCVNCILNDEDQKVYISKAIKSILIKEFIDSNKVLTDLDVSDLEYAFLCLFNLECQPGPLNASVFKDATDKKSLINGLKQKFDAIDSMSIAEILGFMKEKDLGRYKKSKGK